jgi:hypothetical protein
VEVLKRLGLDFEVLDAGCCGMAGAFGFEQGDHYDVSTRAGERVLLPAVRQAAADTLIIADGFSCREQIHQGTGRGTLHLAEALALALRHGEREPTDVHAASAPNGSVESPTAGPSHPRERAPAAVPPVPGGADTTGARDGRR